MTGSIERQEAEELLAVCPAAGVRVLLIEGKIYAGTPNSARIDEGAFGWRPPPRNVQAEIERLSSTIAAILGYTGTPRPWAVERLDGGVLVYWLPPTPLQRERNGCIGETTPTLPGRLQSIKADRRRASSRADCKAAAKLFLDVHETAGPRREGDKTNGYC